MKGMTESELQACANGSTLKSLRKFPFWSAEVYGYGKIIRQYGYYPSFLPLCIQTDHGPTQVDAPVAGHLHPKAIVQFFHSQRLVNVAKNKLNIPCYSLYSPFVFYRRKNNISQIPTASGTLAFPAHSTHHVGIVGGYEDYADLLLELPEEYQPISVCMYFLDIQKGFHKPFVEKGLPVFTAGDWINPKFPERFYNLLSQFKYSTSNLIGSYLFYSVEMGTPFFLYGEKPTFKKITNARSYINNNKNRPVTSQYHKVLTLFSPMYETVTAEQRSLVESELGITSGVSRKKMSLILYFSLIKYYSIFYSLKFLRFGGKIKNKLKKVIH